MNLKPFNLEEAKANPERVVTRDGRKCRILCDDLNDNFNIVAAVPRINTNIESVWCFKPDGSFLAVEKARQI